MELKAVQNNIVAIATELPKKEGLVLPQTNNEANRANLYKVTSSNVSWIEEGMVILVNQKEILRTRIYEKEYALFNASAVLAILQ